MKLTKSKLKQIIKEELAGLQEWYGTERHPYDPPDQEEEQRQTKQADHMLADLMGVVGGINSMSPTELHQFRNLLPKIMQNFPLGGSGSNDAEKAWIAELTRIIDEKLAEQT